jgi:nitroreductase / dihydropteridine reductase
MKNINETIRDAFQWRAAVKVYDKDKSVSDADMETILEAARMAPSAYGLQPHRIIEVKDMSLRTELVGAAFGQTQVALAPRLLIVAVRTDINDAFITEFVERTAKVRGIDVATLSGFRDMMLGDINSRSDEDKFAWAGRQAYIALGTMLETAALLGVDAGPMEGFSPAHVNEILGLTDMNLSAIGLLALGYRGDDSWSTLPKVRVSKEDFVITR